MSNLFRFGSAVFLTLIWSLPSTPLTSFGKGIINAVFFCSLAVRCLIRSISLVPKEVLLSVLDFLVVHIVSFVAAILSEGANGGTQFSVNY